MENFKSSIITKIQERLKMYDARRVEPSKMDFLAR